ncbi:MAG: hypothetical protein J3Q66DRAFT_355815 [Benniella sp.]|nr:MAG: hypothetical protein J3Q66DRAFT_355815 [Benniella sp.]
MFRQSQPKKQIPKPPSPGPELKSSLHSNTEQPLSNVVISFAGLSAKEKDVLSKKISHMGGQVSDELDKNVKYLVASDSGQDEYKAALRLRIPVLKPGWISDIYKQWTKGQSVDMDKAVEKFAMGPLSGCGICVTGLLTETRQEIERDTILLGGKYTHDLLRHTTTHLICGHPSGPKYESAIQWGTAKCVPIQWFKDTFATLELADPSKYTLTAHNRRRSKDSDATRTSNRGADVTKEPAPVVREKMYLESCHIFLCPSFPADQVSTFKKMIRMAGGLHVVEYDPMEVTHVLVPSNELAPSILELFNQDAHLPYIVNQQWLRLSNKKGMVMPEADFTVPVSNLTENDRLNQQPDESNTMNVESVQVTNKDVTDRSRSAVVRSRVLASSTTGSSVSTMTRNHEDQTPSSATSNRATVSMSSSIPPQTNHLRIRARTASAILSKTIDDLTMNSITFDGLPTQESSLVSRTDKMHITDEMDVTQSNIFLGLHITSYGCKESVSKTIREQTVAFGGKFFENLETLPSGPNARVIVPLSTPLDSVKDLKGVVLTSFWFEFSLLEERVVSRNEHFLFQPMKSIPIKGFEELRISVSSTNMKEVEYRQIGRAIKILGATFLDKLHTANTNLLISDYASGPKYEFMAKHDLPIVRMDWLKQCIEQGKRLPFKEYLLISKASGENERADSSSSSRGQLSNHQNSECSRSSDSAITSQINHTQHFVRSDTPLAGFTICMSSRIDGNYQQMMSMINRMGGCHISAYASIATHLIHKGKATPEVKRVIRSARKDGVRVVSPDWLYKCEETGIRPDERNFPETYDEWHLTLNMAHTQTKDLSARILPPRPSQSLSPGSSGRAGRTLSPSASLGWSATAVTQYHHNSAGNTWPSQSFQGTPAGVTSLSYGGDTVPSSLNMSSYNNSMEVPLTGVPDMNSQQQDRGTHPDMDTTWRPMPMPVLNRETRKRRRAQTAPESVSSDPTKDTVKSNQTSEDVTEDDSDKPKKECVREDGVYWVDVEGTAKKRALIQSLGFRTFETMNPGSDPPDHPDQRLLSIAQDLESQRSPKYRFLLTGLTVGDRNHIRKTVQDLGGVILEDITEDQEEWGKCTHLITNGSNPPRTAKLVIAKVSKAIIVTKGFMFASAEKGAFVDETPYRVHM